MSRDDPPKTRKMRSRFRDCEGQSLVFEVQHAQHRRHPAGALARNGPGSPCRESPIADYHAAISPILEKHCYECHGDGYDKGKVAFDASNPTRRS